MASMLNGKFVWYELTSPDVAAARRFYGDVLGWQVRDGQIPGLDYGLMSAAGTDIAGSMQQEAGMPASWTPYICVDDIDAVFAGAVQAGATSVMPVSPIPNVGRFTIMVDPQGAPFGLIEYAADFPKPAIPAHGIHGHGWWRELHTSDYEKAFAFYGALFGWVKSNAMDMGPMGVYQLIAPEGGGDNGGMLNDGSRAPFWLTYFWVTDIDVAHDAVTAGGGTVVNRPMEVPGGAWVFEGRDPQGVTFALVGDRKKK